jgi:hypothetical protein
MNLYCGALSTHDLRPDLVSALVAGSEGAHRRGVVLFGFALTGAILSKDAFIANYEDFILLLLYVLVPWTAINLVDYYLLRHGEYDVESFFQQDGGIYGRVNSAAVACYVLGILVQLPFVASPSIQVRSRERWAGSICRGSSAWPSPHRCITGWPTRDRGRTPQAQRRCGCKREPSLGVGERRGRTAVPGDRGRAPRSKQA